MEKVEVGLAWEVVLDAGEEEGAMVALEAERVGEKQRGGEKGEGGWAGDWEGEKRRGEEKGGGGWEGGWEAWVMVEED